jgi:type II secretion system protein H
LNNHPFCKSPIISDQQGLSIQNGLTVFELIAVICIIGILTSLSFVFFKPLWEKHQIQQAADEIENQIQLLRMKAILENNTYEMKLTNQIIEYRKRNSSHWEDWRKYVLKKTMNYSMPGSIYFDSKGFTSPKTITISLKNRFQQIIININGRVRKSEII